MKHYLLLFLLLFAFLPLSAQEEPITKESFQFAEPVELTFLAEYGYNYSWLHHGTFALKSRLPFYRQFELGLAAEYNTANVLSAGAAIMPKFPLPVGELFLESRLLYKGIFRAQTHDLCTSLSIGYRMDYVSVTLGNFSRFMWDMNRPLHSDNAINTEAFNMLYRIEVFCRPQSCNWNISACFSNVDDFQMERMWQPIFMLGGMYRPSDHWQVMLQAQCKPTGMFHLDASFYGANVRAGVTYKF